LELVPGVVLDVVLGDKGDGVVGSSGDEDERGIGGEEGDDIERGGDCCTSPLG
jgi:hypothetical protein